MSDEITDAKPESSKRLFVPSLTILMFAVSMSGVMITIFLPEIAETFLGSTDKTAIGLASQTATVNGAAEVILAFLMSVLAVRFRHKSLLVVGALLVIFANAGSFLAPDFITFQVFFAMEGAGSVMVAIIAMTLIGDTLTQNKKVKAVSWFIAGQYMSGLIGIPFVLFLANAAGWRSVFLLFVLPISLAGLILAYIAIPKPREKPFAMVKNTYLTSFRQVFTNRSAASTLLGSIIGSAAVVGVYVLTFYRQQFSLSRDVATGIGLVNAALFIVGSLVGGKLISRFGSKRVAVVCGFASGVLTLMFFNIPILWLTLAFNFVSVIIGGCSIPAFACLVVDQVPKSRGTMMSLNRITKNLGEAIGAGIGGVLLALFSYQALGVGFGAFMIAQVAIFYLLVKQPTET
jgi:predicted MFS family arabinose efflux permease